MRKNSIKFIIKEENINYYSWSLIADGFTSPKFKKRYVGGYVTLAVMDAKDDAGAWGVDLEEWYKIGATTLSKMKKERIDLATLTEKHLIMGERLSQICDQMTPVVLRSISLNDIGNRLKKIWVDIIDLNSLGFIPVISDLEHSLLSNELSSILKSHGIKPEQIQDNLSKLISANKPDLYWKEQSDLLKIINKYRALESIKKSPEFQRHIAKYFWLNFGYQGPVWTRVDFINKIKKILKSESSTRKQYLDHKNYFKKLAAAQKRLEKKLRLNHLEKYLFRAAREFMYLKAYRVNVRHRVQYVSELIFSELSKRLGFPVSLFRYAKRSEILKVLSGKRIESKSIIARRNGMLQITQGAHVKFVSYRKKASFLRDFELKERIENQNLVSGQAAFLGKVKGIAKRVFGIKDIGKVKNGEILVAVSTTPDLLPAMHRAAAFVTDEGGITCHAAIISRELKIPCIIGTKIATKVFKDGDLVEVDANAGIVRKLERSGG